MKLFDLTAPFYDRFRFAETGTVSRIKELGQFVPTDVVLDVGGGTGIIAKYLSGQVHEIVVVDSSAEMLKQCDIKKGLRCVQADAQELPFPDCSFDKIVMVDAFHHFFAQRNVLREIRRVLRPGGTAIVEEFHPQRLGGRLIVFLESLLRFGSTFYQPEDLKVLFEKEGFTVMIYESRDKEYYLTAQK